MKERFLNLKTLSFYLNIPEEICKARLQNRGAPLDLIKKNKWEKIE